MVEQFSRRRLDEGPSSSDADAEARRVHKIIRWMQIVLREILDEFVGFPDPIKAQPWLREMEKTFELAEVKDDKKEQYASYYLKDELKMRFLNLGEEDITVAEYEVKFLELARFVPEHVNMKARKAKRFQQGLNRWIRSQVALLEIRTYAALVQKTMIVEGEREATKKESEGKRKFEESDQEQGSSKFGGKFGKNVGNQNQKFQMFKPGNGNQKNHFQKTGQSVKDNRPHI
ncbi:hypothetical protein AgCh_010446 [Apium graveolens]